MINLSLFGKKMMPSKAKVKKRRELRSAVAGLFDGVRQVNVAAVDPSDNPRAFAPSRADEVRVRLADRGIVEQDVSAAVRWARDLQKS